MEGKMCSPSRKKSKRSSAVQKVSAAARAKQFEDLYVDGDVLFYKYCSQRIDFVRVHTIKDHLKLKKHIVGRKLKAAKKSSYTYFYGEVKVFKRGIYFGFYGSYAFRKNKKIKPFLVKHCQQGGALPHAKFLRSDYVPRLFDQHFQVLKTVVADTPVGIVTDETTDIRDHSILNVVALVRGKCYLIGLEKMVACNHATFSQAIIKSVSDVGIKFENVTAIVPDSAAYC